MSQYRYVTIDGQPPWDGRVPDPNAPLPVGNNGGILGSGIIGIVCPRPDVGSNPNWKPWDNVPGLPTAATASTAPPATRAPIPPGGNVPETDKTLRLPSGMGYIFPKDHVTIHVVEPGYFPWENPRKNFQWRAYRVPTFMTLAEFIGQICQLSDEQKEKKKTVKDLVAKKIFECIELGDGVWGRGIEYCIGDGKGKDEAMKKTVKQTLGQIGWDSKRGQGASPPIWVATEAITK